MNIAEKILGDREKKIRIINGYLDKYDCVTLKANIMGSNKNTFESFFLVNYFEKILDDKLPNFEFKRRESGYDGVYILYLFSKDLYKDLKEKVVTIEEENELGRLIDLDVYVNNLGSIHRGLLRKCLICDNPAFVCNRLKTHSYQELIDKMDQLILDKLTRIIRDAIDLAVETELALPYKFGCVCLNDNGSHRDMNALVMRKAKEAIIPGLVDMFQCGFNSLNLNDLFKKIRKIGLDTENEMYLKTNGVNCYKGLIFLLGLLVSSIGYYLKNQYLNLDFNNIFDNIKEMSKELINELSNSNTYGLLAYQKYQFKGARHEAISGLVNVKNCYRKCDGLNEYSLEKVLIEIIKNIDDTVMLKRAKTLEKYLIVKQRISSIKTEEELIEVNKYCISENISVGGACDILIAVIFLKLLNEKIKIDGESYA